MAGIFAGAGRQAREADDAQTREARGSGRAPAVVIAFPSLAPARRFTALSAASHFTSLTASPNPIARYPTPATSPSPAPAPSHCSLHVRSIVCRFAPVAQPLTKRTAHRADVNTQLLIPCPKNKLHPTSAHHQPHNHPPKGSSHTPSFRSATPTTLNNNLAPTTPPPPCPASASSS